MNARQPTLRGYFPALAHTIFGSAAIPSGTLGAVDPASFCSGFDSTPDITSSIQTRRYRAAADLHGWHAERRQRADALDVSDRRDRLETDPARRLVPEGSGHRGGDNRWPELVNPMTDEEKAAILQRSYELLVQLDAEAEERQRDIAARAERSQTVWQPPPQPAAKQARVRPRDMATQRDWIAERQWIEGIVGSAIERKMATVTEAIGKMIGEERARERDAIAATEAKLRAELDTKLAAEVKQSAAAIRKIRKQLKVAEAHPVELQPVRRIAEEAAARRQELHQIRQDIAELRLLLDELRQLCVEIRLLAAEPLPERLVVH